MSAVHLALARIFLEAGFWGAPVAAGREARRRK
jgi:hypothetical protein